MGLSEAEIQRYARHIILQEVGGRGQVKLRGAAVLLLGLGGVGASAAAYLGAAGVGRLGLIDPRPVGTAPQSGAVLFAAADAERPRAAAAVAPLEALNPHMAVQVLAGWPAPDAAGWDVVLASAGDWPAWAEACGTPLLLAGAGGDAGALAWLAPGPDAPAQLAAWQTVVPALAPEVAGAFAPVAGAIGTAAATEAIKRILGIGTPLVGILTYDAATGLFAAS